jgi:hypothetical protein
MKAEEHTKSVGAIVTNLQALETSGLLSAWKTLARYGP